LPLPLAPDLAARAAGIQVELQAIIDAHGKLQARAADVVVEGVGGWAAPLSADLMQADVVRALDIPVLLVVGLRLGCLNHAILSAQAIAAGGCRLVGWIGNAIDPHMERRDAHRALLEARIDAPCCGWLPHLPAADGVGLSRYLVIPD
ncbi:MAG: bioD, partial [Xanthomonadaceae bacterium]|nr:bioD [Xanthomonadaceae bacterium]